MKIKADQPLQTKFQVTLMKIHGVIEKVENFLFRPFRWLMDSNTAAVVEADLKYESKFQRGLKDLTK